MPQDPQGVFFATCGMGWGKSDSIEKAISIARKNSKYPGVKHTRRDVHLYFCTDPWATMEENGIHHKGLCYELQLYPKRRVKE